MTGQCLDCALPYEDFPLDMLFPRHQWLTIHPDEHGLLCAACMVKRASLIPGVIAIHAVIEIAPHDRRICSTCQSLRSFELTDEIKTCPTLNIRIATREIQTFGCNLWEPTP